MLRIEDLSVSYGGIKAVVGASLEASAGEITCIIGRNGSGKSSFVNATAGLVRAQSGSVELDGREVSKLPAWRRARAGIALVPEDRRIFASLSVRENLLLAWRRGGPQPNEAIDEVVGIFPEIANFLDRAGNEISGGQQQMVAIARGLMRRPALLILDEPSLGLAPIVVTEVFRAIKSIAERGQAVLLIEQNARAALEISARGYAMSLGQLRMLDESARTLDADRLAELYL
jgi:branched-chain amino acid transport system ATP-binding protein